MYKIGIIGSGPELFVDQNKVQRAIVRCIDLLGFQYGHESTVFDIKPCVGTGLWAAEACIDLELKYHLFLPYSLEKTCEHWYEDQKEKLYDQYSHAYSLTICHQDISTEELSYEKLIRSANFVVCFWAGNKQGKIYESIKYALSNNKVILNGLDDLKLMTNSNIRRGKK